MLFFDIPFFQKQVRAAGQDNFLLVPVFQVSILTKPNYCISKNALFIFCFVVTKLFFCTSNAVIVCYSKNFCCLFTYAICIGFE